MQASRSLLTRILSSKTHEYGTPVPPHPNPPLGRGRSLCHRSMNLITLSPARTPALAESFGGYGLEIGGFFFSRTFDVRQQIEDFVGAQQIYQAFRHGRDF